MKSYEQLLHDYEQLLKDYNNLIINYNADIEKYAYDAYKIKFFLPNYCNFIFKLNQYYNFSISTSKLIELYSIDTFSQNLDMDLANLSFAGYKLTIDEIYELNEMELFFRRLHQEYQFSDSHDLINHIRKLKKLDILFPKLMGKFETTKNEFIGFANEIYELICFRLKIRIAPKGNSTINKFTAFKNLDN